jgi:hypothetical protein
MDLLFSSSIRNTAVPALTLYVEIRWLPFSRSFESTIYVIEEMKMINICKIRQSHNAGNKKLLLPSLGSFKVDKLVSLAKE